MLSGKIRHLECFYHYRGTYDYVGFRDSDDFFMPRVPGQTQIKYYIQKYCSGETVGSCAFKWLWLFPDVCGMRGEVGPDGNVTDRLVSHKLVDVTGRVKSVHSTRAVLDSTFHDSSCEHCMLPGFEVVTVPPHIAYIAHNRMHGGNRGAVC